RSPETPTPPSGIDTALFDAQSGGEVGESRIFPSLTGSFRALTQSEDASLTGEPIMDSLPPGRAVRPDIFLRA
ncbi:MAG: hypothetical protein PVF54_05040, partial [Anaerolineae bacterium]